jgi:hypothetical protein
MKSMCKCGHELLERLARRPHIYVRILDGGISEYSLREPCCGEAWRETPLTQDVFEEWPGDIELTDELGCITEAGLELLMHIHAGNVQITGACGLKGGQA